LFRASLSENEAPRSVRLINGCECFAPDNFHSHRKGHNMFVSKLTRRGFAATAATGLAAIGLLGASAQSADAYQGNMERALTSLQQALESLRESTANKGGHRARAMDLVRQAIAETQSGVEFADEHGGGGR
jgi:hypothetical protein